MSLRERFIYKAAIGFSLGIFVDIIIKAIFISSNGEKGMYVAQRLVDFTGSYPLALLLDLSLVGLLGGVCNGAAVVYEIESWSALRATLTHFIFSITACMITGRVLGWFTPDISLWNVIQYTIWVLVYAMIWIIQYVVYKKEVSEMNKSVEFMKKNGERN